MDHTQLKHHHIACEAIMLVTARRMGMHAHRIQKIKNSSTVLEGEDQKTLEDARSWINILAGVQARAVKKAEIIKVLLMEKTQ